MTRKIEGIVSILDCQNCQQTSPHMIFSGDTDMATSGLTSLTSATANEIVILETDSSEWNGETGQDVENGVNKQMSRDDLRFVRLLEVEKVAYPAGLGFQDFRKVYREPRLTYSCPKCRDGKAVPGRSLAPSEYRSEGGQLTLLGPLQLRD